MLLPIDALRTFFAGVHLPSPLDEATELLLTEIRARLGYLADVGLAYLTLDRQSRTLSGGEVHFLETLDTAAQWEARRTLLRGAVPPSLIALS